jgi:hypothetical protein
VNRDPDGDGSSKSIHSLAHSGYAVWIVSEQSSKVRAFHVVSLECIAEVKVAGVVNKVLAGKEGLSLVVILHLTMRAFRFLPILLVLAQFRGTNIQSPILRWVSKVKLF